MKDVKDISVGSACFLVKDSQISLGFDSEFVKWLEENGFESCRGWWDGVDWIYINLNSKTYMCGMPGVSVTEPIGKHAITIDEFKEIYNIFDKYKNKGVLCF